MPELNLEALKNKKRTTDKYRPYDIPTPSKKTEDKAPAEETKTETKPIEVKKEQVASVKEIKAETTVENNKEEVKTAETKTENTSAATVKNETATESEIALKKKIKELEEKLNKNSGKDESIPSLEPTDSGYTTFNYNKKEIDNEVFYKILKTTSNWIEPERKLFLYILEMTNYGKTNDVQLGRRNIENNAIHGSHFTSVRESLVEKGVLSYRSGYIGTTKKKAVFYSIILRNFFN